MNIFARLFHKARNHFARPLTPCMQALQDELNRKAIRELVPLQFSLSASEATAKQTFSVIQYYRDQRAAGVEHGVALLRARARITAPKSGGKRAQLLLTHEGSQS